MELQKQATSVTEWFSLGVTSPKRRGLGVAVCAEDLLGDSVFRSSAHVWVACGGLSAFCTFGGGLLADSGFLPVRFHPSHAILGAYAR